MHFILPGPYANHNVVSTQNFSLLLLYHFMVTAISCLHLQ